MGTSGVEVRGAIGANWSWGVRWTLWTVVTEFLTRRLSDYKGLGPDMELEEARRADREFPQTKCSMILSRTDNSRGEWKVFALAPRTAFLEKARRPRKSIDTDGQ